MGAIKKTSRIYLTKKNSPSFTLIETIIVVGITGMVMPLIFSIVFIILQEQSKIIRLQEVKKQGDFIMSSMKTTIKNYGSTIYSEAAMTNEMCATQGSQYPALGGNDGTAFYFKDRYGNRFNYYRVAIAGLTNVYKISSSSAATTVDLSNSKVNISAFSLSCNRESIFSPPIIKLSLTVSYNTTSTRAEDVASLIYNTNIKLKSF